MCIEMAARQAARLFVVAVFWLKHQGKQVGV
jgi:hypothetical protein